MPRGVPLTPDQVETIIRVWNETGNRSEAARAANCDGNAARRAIAAAEEPKRAELHARAMARAEREYRRAVTANLARVKSQLESAATPKEFADVAKVLHDGLRTLSSVRTAAAKMTGDHAAEKRELTGPGGAPLALYLPDET